MATPEHGAVGNLGRAEETIAETDRDLARHQHGVTTSARDVPRAVGFRQRASADRRQRDFRRSLQTHQTIARQDMHARLQTILQQHAVIREGRGGLEGRDRARGIAAQFGVATAPQGDLALQAVVMHGQRLELGQRRDEGLVIADAEFELSAHQTRRTFGVFHRCAAGERFDQAGEGLFAVIT